MNREQAEALIQKQIAPEILQGVPQGSIFMQLARKLPNMTSNQTVLSVLDTLPLAYFVNGDTGFKGVSKAAWDNVYLYAEELAVIVPIPEAVIADASYDIIGEVKPRIIEAINARVDEAVIYDIGRPKLWPIGIIGQARNAGNAVAVGTDMYTATLGENGLFAKVEEAGYAVNGVVSDLTMKAKLRGIRTKDGQPLFTHTMQEKNNYALDGVPMFFPKSRAGKDAALMVAGDFSQAVYAIREDIEFKILDQAIIQDPETKAILYNLAQQDMIAIRARFRMGWALPNFATLANTDRLAIPFAYMAPGDANTGTQKVTLTITEDGEKAIVGALVEVNGQRFKSGKGGQLVLQLNPGVYAVKAKAAGRADATAVIEVSKGAVTQTLTLPAKA